MTPALNTRELIRLASGKSNHTECTNRKRKRCSQASALAVCTINGVEHGCVANKWIGSSPLCRYTVWRPRLLQHLHESLFVGLAPSCDVQPPCFTVVTFKVPFAFRGGHTHRHLPKEESLDEGCRLLACITKTEKVATGTELKTMQLLSTQIIPLRKPVSIIRQVRLSDPRVGGLVPNRLSHLEPLSRCGCNLFALNLTQTFCTQDSRCGSGNGATRESHAQ